MEKRHGVATPELKRVLDLPAVVFIAIGFTIGGGVFVFTGIAPNIFKSTFRISPRPWLPWAF